MEATKLIVNVKRENGVTGFKVKKTNRKAMEQIKTKLAELFAAYDVAKTGRDVQDERIKEIENELLAENEFKAVHDFARFGVKEGDRISDRRNLFMLSENEFDRFLKLSSERKMSAGIIDGNGRYTVDWLGVLGDTRRELVGYIIGNVLPEELREQFAGLRLNVVYSERLIETVREHEKSI